MLLSAEKAMNTLDLISLIEDGITSTILMIDVEGGKGVRFFQAQNAFLLKLIQTNADEIRQLRPYIEYIPTKKNVYV